MREVRASGRASVWGAGLAIAGLLITSCSSSSAPKVAAAPTTSPATTGGSQSPSGTVNAVVSGADTDREAVEKAYRAFWDVMVKASSDPKYDAKTLDAVATPAMAKRERDLLLGLFGGGAHMVGTISINVRSVDVRQNQAALLACLDGRKWFSIPLGDTKVLPNDAHEALGPAKASLIRSPSGTWKMDTRDDATGFTCT